MERDSRISRRGQISQASQVSRGGQIRGRGRHVARVTASAAAVVVLLTAVLTACAARPSLDLEPGGAAHGIAVSRNVQIQLTDGHVLRADLYEPTEPQTGQRSPGPFPVIVGITPYGKAGATGGIGGGGVNLDLVRNGYIAAAVDAPGTGVSDGRFDLFSPDEAIAEAQVISWAAELPRSNGRVGMLGHSYAAINQLFTAAEVGPGSPLRAIFPMAATADPYRDLFVSGGALNVLSPLGLLFSYGATRSITPFSELPDDLPTALRYAAANFDQMSRFEAVMAKDMFTNGPRRYDGDFWQTRAPSRVLQRIADNGVAVYLVGGLYDVFQRSEPLLYSGLQNAAAGRDVDAPMPPSAPVSGRFQLLFGPWTHGAIGDGVDLTAVQLRWFDRWLKDIDNGVDRTAAPMHVIEPGGASYDTASYPTADATTNRLWLRSANRLSNDAPNGAEPTDSLTFTGIGDGCSASTVQFAAGIGADQCLVERTRPESGPGEVTYSTPPISAPMQLAGPIGLTLHAQSSRPDTLFAVTIEDVGPDGRSRDITGGSQLGSMRALDPGRSWTAPDGGYMLPWLRLTESARTPVPIDTVVRYDIEVRPAFATITAGHRLRLRIATADFPHIVPLADMADLAGATYQVHHDAVTPSFIDLPVRR